MVLLGTPTWNTTAGNKTVTATPTAVGALIIVVAANSGRTTAQAPTITDNNSSGTYTQVASATKATNVDSMWIFIRNSPIYAATSTIFTMTQTGDTGGGLAVLETALFTNFNGENVGWYGGAAMRQTGKQDNAATGTPSITMPAAFLTTNSGVAAVFTGSNITTNTTAPTGWTERFDNGYNSPASGLEVAELVGGETRTTVPWQATTSSAFCSLMVELDVGGVLRKNRIIPQLLAH